jgi:hypothetical protein
MIRLSCKIRIIMSLYRHDSTRTIVKVYIFFTGRTINGCGQQRTERAETTRLGQSPEPPATRSEPSKHRAATATPQTRLAGTRRLRSSQEKASPRRATDRQWAEEAAAAPSSGREPSPEAASYRSRRTSIRTPSCGRQEDSSSDAPPIWCSWSSATSQVHLTCDHRSRRRGSGRRRRGHMAARGYSLTL